MEAKGCNWNKADTRRLAIEEANKRFDDTIRKRDKGKEAKLWHQAVQRFCGYAQKNGLIDTQRGPVAHSEDYNEAEGGTRTWDQVRMACDSEEIASIQME